MEHENMRLKAQLDAMKARLERSEGRVLSMEQRLGDTKIENQRQKDLNGILSAQLKVLQENIDGRNLLQQSSSHPKSAGGHEFHSHGLSSPAAEVTAGVATGPGLDSPLLHRDSTYHVPRIQAKHWLKLAPIHAISFEKTMRRRARHKFQDPHNLMLALQGYSNKTAVLPSLNVNFRVESMIVYH